MNGRTPPEAQADFLDRMARSRTLGLLQEAQMHGVEIHLIGDELHVRPSRTAPTNLLLQIEAAKVELATLLKNSAEVFDFATERRHRLPRIKRERMRRECDKVRRRMGWQRPPRLRQPWPFDDGPPGDNAA